MVSKTQDTYSEEQVLSVFNTAKSLDDIERVIKGAEDRIYTTWATVDSVDNDKQKVPIEEAVNQMEILMKRDAPIQDTHTNKNVGRTLAYRVLEHPVTKTIGILHLNKIYNDNILDDRVWEETVSGKRKGSSVGGFSTDKQVETEGGSIFESLKGFNWLETSNVENPCNPHATNHAMSLVAKSEEKMVEKLQDIKKEGEEDVSTETTESSVEDRVSALEETMGMALSKLDEVISAVAGTPEVEKEAEEETPKAEEETEKMEDEEVEKEDEEPKKEDEEVAKSLKEIKTELSELKKKFNVVEVVKSELPSQVNKAEKQNYVFTDVMKGKISLNKFRGEQ